MLNRARASQILRLASPILIALASSMTLTIIDLAMVSELGNSAVAAVGFSDFIFTVISAFVFALIPAVQGVVAMRAGEGESVDQIAGVLRSGLWLAFCVGAPLSIACYFCLPSVYSLLTNEPSVHAQGVSYLSMLLIGLPAQSLNCVFQGYWNGLGKTKLHMMVILFCNTLKILLNSVLIHADFGHGELGILGAGLASTITMYAGTSVYFILLRKQQVFGGFGYVDVNRELVRKLAYLSVPVAVQNFTFYMGSIVLFWIYGLMGIAELAAATVLVRIIMIMFLIANALGTAGATLVSNEIGKGNLANAEAWGWDVAKLGLVLVTLLGLPLFLFPSESLALFIHDSATIQLAMKPLQLSALTSGLVGLSFIFATILFSVGAGKPVAILSFALRWLIFIPLCWLAVVHFQFDLFDIWFLQTVYGVILMLSIMLVWKQGGWRTLNTGGS